MAMGRIHLRPIAFQELLSRTPSRGKTSFFHFNLLRKSPSHRCKCKTFAAGSRKTLMDHAAPEEKLPPKRLAYAAHRMLQKAVIKPHILAELTVEEMAKRLNVSTSHLSRSYREYYRESLRAAIRFYKFICFRVRAYVYQPTTVKKILEQMDINSVSHFIKEYKASYGHTPGQYNRECRKEWEKQQKEIRKNSRKITFL